MMNTHSYLLVTLLLGIAGLGCATGGGVDQSSVSDEESVALGDGLGLPAPDNNGPLPAFEVDRGDRKEDSFDVRGGYEDIFGITAPPRGSVRAIAEFEAHDGVLVDWDSYNTTFMIEMLVGISQAAPLHILTDSLRDSQDLRFELTRYGANADNLNFFEFQNNAFWARDYGPIPIATSNGAAFVDQRYYSNRVRDDAVPTLMSRYFDVDAYRPDLSTEGGNFMANGDGLCAATNWLLQGNPGKSESQIRGIMEDYYGCSYTLIVDRLDGEGTGHIDMFAKFISEDTVIVGEYDSREEPLNARILDRAAADFERMNLEVIRMPMPRANYPIYRSYTNSLIINGTVLVPTYAQDRRYEREALDIYRRVMPGYNIVTIDSDDPISIGGAIHCTSMGFLTGNNVSPNVNNPVEPPTPVEPTAPAGTYASTPNAQILDNRTISDSISITDRFSISRAVVNIDIQHTYIGDLRVLLEHDGQTFLLHDVTGGSTDNLVQSYEIRALEGEAAQGDWTLSIQDQASQDQGTLREWSIELQ